MIHARRLLTALTLAAVPFAAATAQKAGPVFQNGQAADRARLSGFHQVDSSGNYGSKRRSTATTMAKKDRIHADVTRPAQTESEGLKVPIVMSSSPYFAGTSRGQVNLERQARARC